MEVFTQEDCVHHFNSIKVRLKHTFVPHSNVTKAFQFHKGHGFFFRELRVIRISIP